MGYVMLFEQFTVKTYIEKIEGKLKNVDAGSVEYWKIYVSEMTKFILSRGYSFLGEGRNRKVFRSKDNKVVLKIPTNESGVFDNYQEHNTYHRSKMPNSDLLKIYPNVRLLKIVEPVVMMDKLDTNINYSEIIKQKDNWWVGFIDCWQVGYDSKGELKAYDFGL